MSCSRLFERRSRMQLQRGLLQSVEFVSRHSGLFQLEHVRRAIVFVPVWMSSRFRLGDAVYCLNRAALFVLNPRLRCLAAATYF